MTRSAPVPAAPGAEACEPGSRRGAADMALDTWLWRALRDAFGAVAAEPAPDALVRLLDTTRTAPAPAAAGSAGAAEGCSPADPTA